MQRILFILPGFLLCMLQEIESQTILRHNTFSYGVNDGLLQSAMIDMAFDRNNFAWISFSNGIQKFDGKNFTQVPQQAGLPEDKGAHFFLTSGKKLLITHTKGISLYDIDNNIFRLVYANRSNSTNKSLFLGEVDGVIYLLNTLGTVTGVDIATWKITAEVKFNIHLQPENGALPVRVSENTSGNRICIYSDSTYYLWDLKAGRLVGQSPRIGSIAYYASNIRMKSPDEIYFFSRDADLYLNTYNFSSGKTTKLMKGPTQSARTFRSYMLFWNGQPYITHYNELHKCSENLTDASGRIVNFQNQNPAGDASIWSTRQDNFGNLFVLTINKGFRKILYQNYPVKYFGVADTEKNYYGCILADKSRNRVLAGAYTHGIFIFDTTQRLIRHIERLPGIDRPFTPTAFVRLHDASYLVFVSGYAQPWRLRSDLLSLSLPPSGRPDSSSAQFAFSAPLTLSPGNVVVFSDKALCRINTQTGKLNYYFAEALPRVSCLVGSSYLSHRSDELVYIDTSTLQLTKTVPLTNTGGVRCYLPDASGNVYLGTNKGIFKVNSSGKPIMQINKQNGLPDECIYAMTWDADSALWCSTNRGLLKIGRDWAVLQLRKEDGLQENEFNTGSVYRSDDNEIFFGGINGMSSFHPAAISAFPDSLTVLVAGLRLNNETLVGDAAAWNLRELKVPYSQNLLSFEFIAMGSHNPDQYIYQYRMIGVEDEWVQGYPLQPVRYHLNPGTYRFQLFASRQFNPAAKPLHEIVIQIKPPFWKSWWFIVCLGIVTIFILSFLLTARTRRKYKKQLQVLEHEKQIKQERERISRDLHDNLGVYANAVLHNAQLLETEQAAAQKERLLSELGFASRNIITSLRETVWALKYEEFSAEECLLRIRNFIQPLTRYYTGIEFIVTGTAPQNMKLHYTKALNLVRILQEAISNSIKHGHAQNICVSAVPSDTNWTISVKDDGGGFDTAGIDSNNLGNGMSNMKTRAAESGFVFEIYSNEEGTVVSVTV